jgi:hypothetical protein
MRRRFIVVWAVFMAVLAQGLVWEPASASAARIPVDGAVLLGFARQYQAGAAAQVHHGVDLACPGGARVASPVSGSVAFAGLVPATDATGARVGCVVVSAGSDRWSLLPLDEVEVHGGQSVGVGITLGSVRQSGDVSSPRTHLHVGLRRSGEYVDPEPELSDGVEPVPGGTSEPPQVTPVAPPRSAVTPPVAVPTTARTLRPRLRQEPEASDGRAPSPSGQARPAHAVAAMPVPTTASHKQRTGAGVRGGLNPARRSRFSRLVAAHPSLRHDPDLAVIARSPVVETRGPMLAGLALPIGAAFGVLAMSGLVLITWRRGGLEPRLAWVRAGP